jgi:hypothetical protein
MAAPGITFHVPTEGAPNKILPLLKAIQDEGTHFDSVKELRLFANELGLGDRGEMYTLANAVGLFDKDEEGQICLSKQAEAIVRLKVNVQAEIVHYLMYTTWRPDQPEQNSFLWSYREVVNSYWERATIAAVADINNVIAEEVNNRTYTTFAGVDGYEFGKVSFSPKSIRGVRKWLEALIPPVIENDGFTRRNFCPAELTLLASGWVAQTMEGEIEIDFLITPPRREAICRLCLLDPNDLDNVLDWMLPNYPHIVEPGTSAGVYGRYLRFLKWPQVTDLG